MNAFHDVLAGLEGADLMTKKAMRRKVARAQLAVSSLRASAHAAVNAHDHEQADVLRKAADVLQAQLIMEIQRGETGE
jgi:hypothetical protein